MYYYVGFSKILNDVAIVDTKAEMENWISAAIEKSNSMIDENEPYFMREELSEESAAMRLLVDPAELRELETVEDEIYPGVHWIVFDNWEVRRCTP